MNELYEKWARENPDQARDLERNEPTHARRVQEGWSWIECWGGPRDGAKVYHFGTPEWEVAMADFPNSVYGLRRGSNGFAVYVYLGEFDR